MKKETKIQSIIKYLLKKEYIKLNNFYQTQEIIGTNDISKEENFFSCYKAYKDLNDIYKYFENEVKVQHQLYEGFLVAYDEERLVVIIKNSKYLSEVGKIIEDAFGHNQKVRENIYIIKYELSCLRPKTGLSEVLDKYHAYVNNNTIFIHKKIVPKHYVISGSLRKIPDEKRIEINKIQINFDHNFNLLSMRIDARHPNADSNGYYCLGDYKNNRISAQLLEELFKRMETYNLDDSYWVPKFAKEHR